MNLNKNIKNSILESSNVITNLVILSKEIEKSIRTIVKAVQHGNKIILFGNGGSAADAQHIAAEFLGRFNLERNSFPALAITSNSSTITALANDYSYDVVFSRQCESIVKRGDVVIGISTSGNSINVKKGLFESKKRGAVTIGLLGNTGGEIKKIVDIPIIINSNKTPKIQEAHRVIYHIICDESEKILSKKVKK